jgi:hypothetical protein
LAKIAWCQTKFYLVLSQVSSNSHKPFKGVFMQARLKHKLEDVIQHVNNVMVDPEINIDYFIPESDKVEDSYILVEYVVSEYTKPTRKIQLTRTYSMHEPQEIANLVTFSIEQFKMEIDSVEMG